MNLLSEKVANFLIRFRWPLLGVAVFLSAIALYPSTALDFDRRIENMFSKNDPLLPPYQKLKDTFHGNEVVGVVYVDPDLLNPDGSGIDRIEKLSEMLKRVPGVDDVLSLSQINTVLDKLRAMDPFRKFKLKTIVDPESQLGANYRQLFQGYTHGPDKETVSLVCILRPQSDLADSVKVPRHETIEGLREVARKLPKEFQPAWVVGEPVMVADGFRYVEEDGWTLSWATTLLLSITIVLCFRSLRWVVIPIAVVQFTLLLTKTLLVVSGIELSMVSSMLTAIVTVVGVATVVHVIVRFREARLTGQSPHKALRNTIALLVVPVFWACATDAIGFGSLLVAEVGPIQDFGLMMAVGSLLVLVSVALVLPGLSLVGQFDTDPQRAWGEQYLGRQLEHVIDFAERRPVLICCLLAAISYWAVMGISRLEVETDFTKNFRSNTPIVQSYQFVESNLGGAGVWDVILPAPATADNADLPKEYLDRVRTLEKKLREIPDSPDTEVAKAPLNWVSHASADGGFSSAFPQDPAFRSAVDTDGIKKHRFAAKEKETGAIYSVAYYDLDDASPEKTLEDAAAAYSELKTAQREFRWNGHQGIEIEFEFKKNKAAHVAKTKLILIDERLYQLMVYHPAKKAEEEAEASLPAPKIDEFLNSFRLFAPALTKVVSVATADEATKVGPILRILSAKKRLARMRDELPVFYSSMLNTTSQDGKSGYLRVMLRARERQPASQKLWLIDRVEKIVKGELDKPEWVEFRRSVTPEGQEIASAEVTGFFVLLTNLIKSMIRDQWVCFGVATLLIALMMAVAFRSPKLAAAALVPNVLPVLVVFGAMGWLGTYYEEMKINMGAAMIAAVSMGLSVDSSIHFITSFQRARNTGKSVHESLIEVQQTVGRAAIFSTLALIVGFSILCTSNFIPTVYFGVLVSVSMLGGLIGNLLVLPLLLTLLVRDPKIEQTLPVVDVAKQGRVRGKAPDRVYESK